MNSQPLVYEFLAPQRIVFGWGRRRELPDLLKPLARRVFVVLGSRTLAANGQWDEMAAALAKAGLETVLTVTISAEPTVADVDRTTILLREAAAGPGDCVLALGGGSALDLAKAAAALATNRAGDSVKDYLEGVGRGCQITAPPLPMIAMPTTGGTGSEATKNAVISCYDPAYKKSLRSNLMIPALVLVDPELSTGVSPATTAWTGMDAITQLIESYVCRFARPIPRALCVEGLRQAFSAIVEAVEDGTSRRARECMAHAALLSGMALANSGLGLAHGVAAALGVYCRVPHGLACATMLPVALRVNRQVSQRDLATLARETLGRHEASDEAAAGALIERIDELCRRLRVPARLGELGVRHEQLPELARGSRGNSMNGNPCELSDEALLSLLESIL